MRTTLFLTVLVAPLLGGEALGQSRPTSATAPATRPSSQKVAAAAAAAEEEEEEEEVTYPSWSLDASAGVEAGYDTKDSLSKVVRLQGSSASATTTISAGVGPTLSVTETLSTSLAYAFEHELNYANHDLDAQTHGLSWSGKYAGDRLEASLSYDISFAVLLPKDVFYSIEHEPHATAEVRIVKPLYLAAEYGLHVYDIRDSSAAYLNGLVHTVELYPDLYFSERLDIYAGYKLQLAHLGVLAETFVLPSGAAVPYGSDQSYTGHFFYAHAKWKPHRRVKLTLDGKVGRKSFPAAIIPLGTGPRASTRPAERVDTFGTLDLGASWRFWRGFSLDGSFSYEKSSSSLKTEFQLSSYDAFAGTLGLTWAL